MVYVGRRQVAQSLGVTGVILAGQGLGRNHHVITGLPEERYTWTLRAVDSAYNGGPVTMDTFDVGVPVDASAASPLHYALDANFPNPFAGSTTLRFALPDRARVRLSVYDVSGRLVARLVDDARAPGVHMIPWDASGLASGTYFVRLSTPAFTRSERILLVK